MTMQQHEDCYEQELKDRKVRIRHLQDMFNEHITTLVHNSYASNDRGKISSYLKDKRLCVVGNTTNKPNRRTFKLEASTKTLIPYNGDTPFSVKREYIRDKLKPVDFKCFIEAAEAEDFIKSYFCEEEWPALIMYANRQINVFGGNYMEGNYTDACDKAFFLDEEDVRPYIDTYKEYDSRDSSYNPEDVITINSWGKDNSFMYTKKEESTMIRVINTNKKAVSMATNMVAGKTLNAAVSAKLVPYLPEQAQVLSDTPIGTLVIANLFAVLADVYSSNSGGSDIADKLTKMSNLMVEAAMMEAADSLDIDGLVAGFLTPNIMSILDEAS